MKNNYFRILTLFLLSLALIFSPAAVVVEGEVHPGAGAV